MDPYLENKLLKEVIRELIPIAEDAVTLIERYSTRKSDHVDEVWQAIIDEARKLLDEQP